MSILLETDRLALHRLGVSDAPFMLRLLNNESFIQNIGDRGIRTIPAASEYIQKGAIQSYEKYGFGLYRVNLKNTGESIGVCGLVKRDALEHADVGFAFFPAYFRKGYAYESASAVMRYARESLGLTTILGVTSPANLGSIRVLEKLGLRFMNTLLLPGSLSDVSIYSTETASA